MNTTVIKFVFCTALLAGCTRSSNQSAPTTTIKNPTSIPATSTAIPLLSPSPTQEEQSTPTPEADTSQTSDSNQETLKDDWRIAYGSSVISFRSCELMFNTLSQLENGEIDITEARADLAIEFFFIRLAYDWNLNWETSNDAVLPFKENVWFSVQSLIQLVEQVDQMSDANLSAPGLAFQDSLFNACFSFNDILSGIVPAAMNTGLTENSLNQLDLELQEMLSDLDSIELE